MLITVTVIFGTALAITITLGGIICVWNLPGNSIEDEELELEKDEKYPQLD